MRIDGLPNLPPKVTQGNQRSDAQRTKRPAAGDDVVEISKGTQDVADLAESIKASDADVSPRVAEVRARVQAGYYDSEPVRRDIADALLRSDSMRETVDDVVQARVAREGIAALPDVREERVAEARRQVDVGHYDTPEVRSETAQRILDEFA